MWGGDRSIFTGWLLCCQLFARSRYWIPCDVQSGGLSKTYLDDLKYWRICGCNRTNFEMFRVVREIGRCEMYSRTEVGLHLLDDCWLFSCSDYKSNRGFVTCNKIGLIYIYITTCWDLWWLEAIESLSYSEAKISNSRYLDIELDQTERYLKRFYIGGQKMDKGRSHLASNGPT